LKKNIHRERAKTMTEQEQIQQFLGGKRFAVVGASTDRSKYGNKVLRAYLQNNREAVPVNPGAEEVEGLPAYRDLTSVPGDVDGVSIITPPVVTEKVVQQAVDRGVKNIWMQPGAESPAAIESAQRAGANVIAGGPCILVAMRYRESG
jgi:predicted CoA-binding protein